MSYSNGSESSGLRSFVSESQLEERRQRRQEEWNKVRKDDDPIEPPEEVYDSRTLFDRLKEQQIKKQEEYEESKKLKHLIKGLDNDEISFLEMVDNTKIEIETQRWKEEVIAIDEYKRAVVHLSEEEEEKRMQEMKKDILPQVKNDKKRLNVNNDFKTVKKSQSALLANVVKKRSNSDSNDDKADKKVKIENITSDDKVLQNANPIGESTSTNARLETNGNNRVVKCIGILPGVGYYASSDSSDSENSSNSENDRHDEVMSGFKLIVRKKRVTPEAKTSASQAVE